MDALEFDDRFDVLYNNITSNQAPGLNAYEKSLFLTKAQDEILKNYFNPKGNKYQEGFDGNPKRQIDFSSITVSASPEVTDGGLFDARDKVKHVSLPKDVWMIINERLEVTRGKDDKERTVDLVVLAITFDEYDRLMSKPYKRPNNYQAWRLITHNGEDNNSDLIAGPNDEITEYKIRYIKRPHPIIVDSLDDLTIDGYCFTGDGFDGAEETEGCELDPILHEEILQRAVELAKVAWTTTGQDNLQAVMQAGQRSE
jgi:hypothetical protein